MSSSLKARVWFLIATHKDGSETVECVKDEKIDVIDDSRDMPLNHDIVGLRVVMQKIDVRSDGEATAESPDDDLPVWREDRYRVRIVGCDNYPEAVSPLMSLQEAAKLACSWDLPSRGYVDILPPTDSDCQLDGEDDDNEPAATEQAEHANGELVAAGGAE